LLLLLSVSVQADPDPVELSEPFYSRPVLYENAFYGFSDQHTFSKVSDAGQVSWRLQDDLDAEKPFTLHFNQLIFITKSGGVIAYDSALGNELWAYDDSKATHFFVRNPNVFVLRDNGTILCLDLFTGRKKWLSTTSGISEIRPAGRSGVMLGRKGRMVHFFEIHTGHVIETKKTGTTSGRFVTDWNRGVVQEVSGEYQLLDVVTGELETSGLVPSSNMVWFQNHYPVVVDDERGELRQYNVETEDLAWVTSPTHDIQDVHFSDGFALLSVPSDNMVIVDLKDGTSFFRESPSIKGAIQGLFNNAETIYILFQQHLLKIKRSKLNDE
jgi:hypothetical protein